ncbi:MAG: hypothetical protein ACRDU9_08650 [Acidimicrobiia bacterium]
MTILLAMLGLLAISGLAAATPAEEEKEDTVFNFGYDEEFKVLLWNLTPNDGLYDCTLENGPLTTTYALGGDGLVQVEGLTSNAGVVTFPNRPQEELAEDLVAAEDPIEYTGAEGECGVSGSTVAGPNGQINHGMFMKTFNSLFEGKGRGCVNRHLAQSDFGTGDQQLQVGDVDPAAPAVTDGDEGLVDFETILADCVHGNEDEVTGQENAELKKAANADRQRGKSGSAPGKNK